MVKSKKSYANPEKLFSIFNDFNPSIFKLGE